ncbi:GNAT family N-acetyltransferase [Demequina gelatinilytica]|uniref:GNAT family N-acetyltransferase n=1 Tax=Demequina gelatinilytica TaxID=1638980 RepID=UPI0009E658FE|nr:GNAT family N-acetyltransferase [Demequina gelatinilytica]
MSPALAVRAAALADVPALVALAAETFPLACPPGTPPETIATHIRDNLGAHAFEAWVADDAATVAVADGDDAPAGYAVVLAGPCGDRDAARVLAGIGVSVDRVLELSKIYVRASSQGSGVAGALLDAALSVASSTHGDLPVWLGTNAANSRAQAFYARHGFTVVGSRTYRVGGQDHSDVVMLRGA